ncbi:MAG: lysylphosphatidylglycerol synthase domain-containing protein [Ruminococcus sp.]|jgi:hypothetical protein|nr:lysylphosphatidylglycerol synthase domain-containing protein [Ruminococcus sp.]
MKKTIKIVGNILTVLALLFVVKKFIDMDADFSNLCSSGAVTAMIISFVLQTLIVIMGSFPWLVFTQSLSGVKIPFSKAMPVYTKSNIYKYLPGNVFQYIGRNKLATDMNISHVDVACATILDIIFCVFSTAIISVLLLGKTVSLLIEKYGQNLVVIACIVTLLFVLIFFVLCAKFREKMNNYFNRYKKAFERGKRRKFIQGILYYFLQNSLSAVMYFVSMKLIIGDAESTSELISLTGAFMFAWIIGFVTPGAPGGIGIRESVMLFVCGNKFSDKIMLFVLALRISSVLADIAAFLIGNIYCGVSAEKSKETY